MPSQLYVFRGTRPPTTISRPPYTDRLPTLRPLFTEIPVLSNAMQQHRYQLLLQCPAMTSRRTSLVKYKLRLTRDTKLQVSLCAFLAVNRSASPPSHRCANLVFITHR